MEIILTMENIVFYKTFLKDLQKFDKQTQTIIQSKLKNIFKFPELQNIKALKNYKQADYRLKIGTWRILFKTCPQTKKQVLFRIKNRKDLY